MNNNEKGRKISYSVTPNSNEEIETLEIPSGKLTSLPKVEVSVQEEILIEETPVQEDVKQEETFI